VQARNISGTKPSPGRKTHHVLGSCSAAGAPERAGSRLGSLTVTSVRADGQGRLSLQPPALSPTVGLWAPADPGGVYPSGCLGMAGGVVGAPTDVPGDKTSNDGRAQPCAPVRPTCGE